MEQKLVKIFQKIKYEPKTDLTENIWYSITLRERQNAKFKLWIFSFFGISSLIGLVPVFKILLNDLIKSGFYEYFSLIFSNSGSVLSSWKEYMFSLAESLPTLSIIYSLSLVFVFFLSLRYVLKQIYKVQSSNGATLSF